MVEEADLRVGRVLPHRRRFRRLLGDNELEQFFKMMLCGEIREARIVRSALRV
jgi:hypothetical protein